jgi:hypothetical protein
LPGLRLKADDHPVTAAGFLSHRLRSKQKKAL